MVVFHITLIYESSNLYPVWQTALLPGSRGYLMVQATSSASSKHKSSGETIAVSESTERVGCTPDTFRPLWNYYLVDIELCLVLPTVGTLDNVKIDDICHILDLFD